MMVDEELQYKLLLNKANIMINDVSKLGMDDEKYKNTLEDIKSYVADIVKVLRSVKFSSTSYYGNKRKIVEKIYEIAYKTIQLEIILFDYSEIYDYINSDDTAIFFINECVRKDVEKLDMKDEENRKINEKIYDISTKGLDTSYVDIELIKLLAFKDNNLLVEDILDKLNCLIDEMNKYFLNRIHLLNQSNNCEETLHTDKMLVKEYKNRIVDRIVSIILFMSIIGGAFFGGNLLSKKISSKAAYPKLITTYSKEYGKKTEDGYSFVEDNEQDKNYLRVYTFATGEVYTYDISDVELGTIEEYLNLNYENLDYKKDNIGEIDNQEKLSQKGYIEVEQIVIDRDKVDTVVDNVKFSVLLFLVYSCLVAITFSFEYVSLTKEEEDSLFGIIHNLYYLIFDIYIYRKEKFIYINKLHEYKKNLYDLLVEINKYDKLRNKINKLYMEYFHLLDNPNELLAKVESLSQDLSKEEIEGKIRSLKRF